ncbi:MAG: hypothetical protein EBT88_14755 [Proteobacteria bacterium]|nr:hypothetical protein [Pseudomonadota bacterium]
MILCIQKWIFQVNVKEVKRGGLVDGVLVVTPPSRGETHEKCGCFKAPPAGLQLVYRLHSSKL